MNLFFGVFLLLIHALMLIAFAVFLYYQRHYCASLEEEIKKLTEERAVSRYQSKQQIRKLQEKVINARAEVREARVLNEVFQKQRQTEEKRPLQQSLLTKINKAKKNFSSQV